MCEISNDDAATIESLLHSWNALRIPYNACAIEMELSQWPGKTGNQPARLRFRE